MKCAYCDQPQTQKDRKKASIETIVREVQRAGIPYVCITGGEPLIQWNSVYPLVLELNAMGYKVAIETNGCCPIESDPYNRSFKYIMDIKCPSSGVHKHNILDNMMNLQAKDEVVFVISDRKDYNFAKKVIAQYPTEATLVFSPCFDDDWEPIISDELIQWLIEDKLFNVRVSVQMHKCLGVQ
jgi:7-carboxy-7-deazaguanine synthase